MGLFDAIAEQAASALSNAGDNGQGGIMEVVAGLLGDSETGGIQALVSAFKDKGLGELVASWIGTGENLPISAEQLQTVLGSEQVQAIAQKLGLSSSDVSDSLAKLLPQAIDTLSPNGQLPEGNMLEQGLALLKRFGT